MMHNRPGGHNTPVRRFQSVKPAAPEKVAPPARRVEPIKDYFGLPNKNAQSAAYAGRPSPASGVTPVADMLTW
jgi:hypothetical protein